MPRVGAPILDALVELRVASPSGGDDAARMIEASANVPLSIVPATSRLCEYWPHLLLPPVAILVFVLHQWLVEPERASV